MAVPQEQPMPLAPEPMPGAGVVALVLIWILAGLGVCASALVGAAIAFLMSGGANVNLILVGPAAGIGVTLLLLGAWIVTVTVLRMVFAVRLRRRRPGARTAATTIEVLDLVVSLVLFAFQLSFLADSLGADGDVGAATGGGCVGAVMSIIVIALLNTKEMRAWAR